MATIITLSTNQIAKIVGVSLSRINSWLNREYVTASIEKASGYGTKNVFSRGDAYKIMLFHKLLKFGLLRETSSLIVNKCFSRYWFKTAPRSGEFKGWQTVPELWVMIYKENINGKEFIRSKIVEPEGYDPSGEDAPIIRNEESDLFLEISSKFIQGSDFVFIFSLVAIMSEVDAAIDNL